MEHKQFLNAADLKPITGRSESYNYSIIRTLNEELRAKGYLVIRGQVPASYFYARYLPEIGGKES